MKLDEHFTLEGKKYNWVLKYREVTDEVHETTGKKIIKTDKWYYPKLSQVLNTYLEESVRPSKSVIDLEARLAKVEETINKLQTNL